MYINNQDLQYKHFYKLASFYGRRPVIRDKSLLANQIYNLLQQGVNLEEISKKLHIYNYELVNIVKKYYGCTPNELKRTVLDTSLSEKIPLLIEKGCTIRAISKTLNLSEYYIKKWLKTYYKDSIFDIRKKNNIKVKTFSETPERIYLVERIRTLLNEGITPKEIQKQLYITKQTFNYLCKRYNIKLSEITKISEEKYNKIPDLIKQGFSVRAISEQILLSTTKIDAWIRKTYNCGIKKLREQMNIKLLNNSKNQEETNAWFLRLSQYLEDGLGITDIAKKEGRSAVNIIYWMEKFNLTCRKRNAQKLLPTVLPDMIARKMGLSEISKTIGLNPSTISRFIKKTYGTTYSGLLDTVKNGGK